MTELHEPVAGHVTDTTEDSAVLSGLFGRDMIYLGFWALQIVLAAALTPVTTRIMGQDVFGQAAVAVAVMQLLNCLFSFSLYTAVQRAYARENGEEDARRILALAIGLAMLFGALVYATGPLWCPLFGLGDFPLTIRYAVLWAVMSAITGSALGLVRSRDHLVGFVAASFAQSVLAQTLALGLVLLVARTASNYILGQLVGEVVTAAIALWIARPLLPRRIHVPMLSESFRFSVALVPAAVAGFMFDAADRIIIHGDLGASELSRYAVARNIGGFAFVLLQLVGFVWMPRLFAMQNRSARRNVLESSRDGLVTLATTFALAIASASPAILWLWAPPSYKPQSMLLITALVAAAAIPYAYSLAYSQALILGGRPKAVAASAVTVAVLNVGLNLLLVPALGINGSAAITCLCNVLGAVSLRWLAGTDGPPTSWKVFAIAITGLTVCIASAAAPASGFALVIRFIAAAAASFAFCQQLAALIQPGSSHGLRQLLAQLRGAGQAG